VCCRRASSSFLWLGALPAAARGAGAPDSLACRVALMRRRWRSVVRETAFVEIGPVTALHHDAFTVLLPFPPVGMGWGLDAHWSWLARERGWPIGVVDLLPNRAPRHGGWGQATNGGRRSRQARAFLADHPYLPVGESQRTLAVHRRCAVAVVAEFYPRRHDPVLGVWAHRQALAARDAGAELSFFVLHRVVPPRRELSALVALARQPSLEDLDGLPVRSVRYLSPPRGRGYARWAPGRLRLGRALRGAGRLIWSTAHNAVPAATP